MVNGCHLIHAKSTFAGLVATGLGVFASLYHSLKLTFAAPAAYSGLPVFLAGGEPRVIAKDRMPIDGCAIPRCECVLCVQFDALPVMEIGYTLSSRSQTQCSLVGMPLGARQAPLVSETFMCVPHFLIAGPHVRPRVAARIHNRTVPVD